MRPAFTSSFQAAAFVFLLLALLTCPLWMIHGRLPPRREAYLSAGWNWAPYPWLAHEIFDETNDIDIAFVGSSHLFWGIDTPYVQKKASELFGPGTVVRTVGWGGPGFDALYCIAKDLLEHHKVRMLVFNDETEHYARNGSTPIWFRLGDEPGMLSGIPLRQQIPYYFATIVGMPRNLVSLLRPNIMPDLSQPNTFQTRFHCNNIAEGLGSAALQVGFHTGKDESPPFHPFTGEVKAQPSDVCVYSQATRTNFDFLNLPYPEWQRHFAAKFGALVAAHDCKLVLVHVPVLPETGQPAIEEPEYWPDLLHTPMKMVGIPPQKLFAGLSKAEAELLYYEPGHLNQNGQRYFTPLIAPALLKIYRQDVKH